MSSFYVVLVEPKYEGNVGAVARLMKNFDFKNLYLVNPCNLGDEAYARSMHAHKILDTAEVFKSYKEAIKDLDFVVATSAIESLNDKRHLRNALDVEQFCEKIKQVKGKIALVFGREDIGLLNEELALCDMLIRIPTSKNYLSLNLSHAVSLVLYSLYIHKNSNVKEIRTLDKNEKERLFSNFSKILDQIDYPEYRRESTEIMFKRIIGRAVPSKWEYHTLMGVFSKSLKKMKK